MPNCERQQVVLLADGACPTHPFACEAFRAASQIVACDGACLKAQHLGRDCDYVVGDGDSISAEMLASLGPRFIHVAEQETNDLAKGFRFIAGAISVPYSLTVLGATGLREDHTLANLFYFADYSAHHPFVRLMTDAGVFYGIPASATHTFKVLREAPVSVFACQGSAHAESEGLAWPLNGIELSPLWRGASNRATCARVCLHACDAPLLVFFPYLAVNREYLAERID